MNSLIDRYLYDVTKRLPDEKVAQWTPKKLPDVPSANAVAIKRSETVTGVIFSVLFTAAFLVGTLGEPRFIALYESGHPAVPVFSEMIILNISRSALDGHIRIALKVVMILIIIGTAADIIATIYKTVKSSRIATVDLSEKTV